MKKVIVKPALLVLSIVFAVLSTHGQVQVLKENRPSGAFTRIVNNCSADILLQQGNHNEIVVEADASVIGEIKTTITGNTLTVDMHNVRPFKKIKRLKLWITVSNLEEIEINGSGDLTTQNPLRSQNLKLRINSSGDARIEMDGGNLDASINGSGDVTLTGVRGTLTLGIHGSGDFEGSKMQLENAILSCFGSGDIRLEGKTANLKIDSYASGDINTLNMPAEKVTLDVKGSGDVKTWATQVAKVKLMCSGDVIIQGNPKDRQISKMGSGSIRFF